MINIRGMKPEEFEDYSKYLFYLTGILDKIVEPTIINLDGKQYIVAMEDRITAVVEDTGDKLEGYATFLDPDGKLISYFDEDFCYEIYNDKDEIAPLVSRKSINTQFIDQVYLKPREDNRPHDYLNYYIKTPEGDKELQIIYDVTRFQNNLDLFFYYIDHKYPESIFLNKFRHVIGPFTRVKHEWFIQVGDDNDYGKIILNLPVPLIPVGPTSYTIEDIRAYLEEVGMPGAIPQDMRKLFLGKNEKVKTLELLTQEYHKYHKK